MVTDSKQPQKEFHFHQDLTEKNKYLCKITTMWSIRRHLSSFMKRGELGLFRSPRFGSHPELELQYLPCTCCWRSRVPLASFDTLNSALTSSEPCKEDGSRPLDTFYTLDQRNAILNVLNTASVSELSSVKLLRGRKSLNIVEYRTKNGPFKTLESVINVPLLKHKSAVIVFNSIVNPEERKKKKERLQLMKVILPEVNRSWLEGANSIVSIICGVKKMAWAHVDRGMTVLDWQQQDCPNFLKGTYMASTYMNDVSSVVSRLPSADFYLIEKSSISMQIAAANLFPITAHLRVVEAMLFALLEPRISPTETNVPPRVLNMFRTAVGRHFRLMVGESRTSGAQIVRRLMMESVTQKLPRVNIPQELLMKYRNHFEMSSKNNGEELSDALLQAVAFYELLSETSG